MSSKKIYLFSFIEGFAVMAVELIGAKLLSVFYGNTLEVWSVMLAVTMFALAVAYFTGGKLSEKKPEKRLLPIILCAVLATLFTVLIANKLIDLVNFEKFNLNLIANALFVLFLPLVFIGMLTPVLIQLNMPSSSSSGKSSGSIFGIATLGGIFAAYFFGFFVIPFFGLKYPLILLAFLLWMLSLLLPKTFNRSILDFIAVFLLFSLSVLTYKKDHAAFAEKKIQHASDGLLGELKVVDFYHFEAKDVFRKLTINNISQSQIKPNAYAQSSWSYPHVFALFLTMKAQSSKALLIGLGGGSVARELLRQNISFDAVELDARIPELAQEYFFLNKKDYHLIVDDGRHYINTTKNKYDIVIFDIASGEVQPNHLYSIEALRQLQNILNKDALVLINFQGNLSNDAKGLGVRTMYKTMKKAGFKLALYSEKDNDISNDVFFILSKDKEISFDIHPERLEECCLMKSATNQAIKHGFSNFKPDLNKVPILTDDKPHLEHINKQIMRYWRINLGKL